MNKEEKEFNKKRFSVMQQQKLHLKEKYGDSKMRDKKKKEEERKPRK
tara:strand:- start:89 stop:229 length:141 start_codon:yes stop_codon:yes gene_type:complete